MYISEIVNAMLERDITDRTKRTYQNYIGQFVGFVSERDGIEPNKLTHTCLKDSNIIDYRKWLESRACGAATIQTGIYALKYLIKVAREDFKLRISLGQIRIPKTKKAQFKGIGFNELDNLYKCIEAESPRDTMIVALMLMCGLRVSEVRNLKLCQLNIDNYLQDVQGKSRRVRDIPLPYRIRPIIKRYLMWRKLFPSRADYPLIVGLKGALDNKPETYRLNEKTIYTIVKEALARANTSLQNPHSLRHTYAHSTLEAIGRNEKNSAKALTMVKTLLGHETLTTTMQYLDPSLTELQKAVEAI
jgi:integrase/recombinase XerC